ncbi:MAG TPA: ABC transporter ATP-binding protein [Crenotrichaceae bacterium]|nr:ABC transporter ATP-binding protein [Crenotrichaceae bacterium]
MAAKQATIIDVYQLTQVRFIYRHQLVINIDRLKIPAQACTVVLGENGAGKTTLLSLLGFTLMPSSGTIFYKGDIARKHNNLLLRQRISAVHQRPYLFRGTVLDNVILPLKLRGVPVTEAREVGMQKLQEVGLLKLSGRLAKTLSGGEAQRTALARCLVTKPEVLLLDEPFSHLDRQSVDLIDVVIRDFVRRGGAVIFSTHDYRHWPDLADFVITLENGRLAENDSVST